MVENERETEALWILFQGDFSDRARCNFISRRRRKCRAARKTRNRKKFDRSIDRAIGRSVGRSRDSADHRFLHRRHTRKNMHTRGNTRFARAIASTRANIWLRSRSTVCRLKFLPPRIFANIFLSSEPGGGHVRFHEFLRKKGERREYFPDSRSTNESRDIEKLFVPGEKTIPISVVISIDLLVRRT